MLLIVTNAMVVSLNVRANEEDCLHSLNLCDSYVIALSEVNEVLKRQIVELDEENLELKESQQSTPWYWWLLGGAAAGLIGGALLK